MITLRLNGVYLKRQASEAQEEALHKTKRQFGVSVGMHTHDATKTARQHSDITDLCISYFVINQ